ncbi:MAG: hypothetical protein EXX96DRAFT_622299 [Benjaminiella poitrasii]|nr:MAG: hypothetical protein EXX96DRAFT_622299 [Benjaminiella poitrasii]
MSVKTLLKNNKKLVAFLTPLILQRLFRTRGSYRYRQALAILFMGIAAGYGVLASLVLATIGRPDLIAWSVARLNAFLNRTFLGITATIQGKHNLAKPNEQVIYVCNHQSIMDIMYLGVVFPKRTSMVAKKSIKYYPFLGWFMVLSQSIFLDRANRKDAIRQARQAADDIHRKRTSVWIFPEGTRNPTTTLLPFKKGAFYMATQAKVPIVPVVIQHYQHIYDSSRHVFRHGDITIQILPRVETKDVPEDSESIEILANKIKDQMMSILQK